MHIIYNTTTTGFLKLRDFVTMQRGRGHDLQLCQHRSQRNLRKYFFGLRVAQVWNSLPLCVMRAQSVQTFKCLLDKHWECQAIKYDYSSPSLSGPPQQWPPSLLRPQILAAATTNVFTSPSHQRPPL